MKPSLIFTKDLLGSIAADNVACALQEDVGKKDLTANLIPSSQLSNARVISRERACICGQAWVDETFRQCGVTSPITWYVSDGQWAEPNEVIFEVKSYARFLLTAERTALNFLQLLSGVATKTARYVEAAQGSETTIVDTRKTIPGLRLAQKYAVLCGGGVNHRIGLFDAILIKENHIAAAGGIRQALIATRESKANFVLIEVETLAQLEEALDNGASMILLDNMAIATITEAVRINNGRAILEISGGVNLENLPALAQTGVDRISIGALTKDVQSIDLSMRFTVE